MADLVYYLATYPWYVLFPVAVSVLLLYLSWRLARGDTLNRRIGVAVGIYLLVSAIFSAQSMLLFENPNVSFLLLVALIFYGLQLLFASFVFVAGLRKKVHPLLTLFAFAVLAVSVYALVEPYALEVTHRQIYLEDAPSLKVVHISDLQTDWLGKRERDVVKIISALQPDIILISGDYFNGKKEFQTLGFASARYVLERLKAPYGVYGVSSDSSPLADHYPLFMGTDAHFLENEIITVEKDGKRVAIAGLSRANPQLKNLVSDLPEDMPAILLYHGPEIIFESNPKPGSLFAGLKLLFQEHSVNPDIYEFDVILVGHTHGGQISLPFLGPLTSGTAYGRKYARGDFWFGDTYMFVNRGIGLEGYLAPKIRFLSRPEIAVFTIN